MNEADFLSKLDCYEMLPDDEKHSVAEFVREHPEYRAELAAAEGLCALLAAARFLEERPVSDLALAYLAVMDRIQQRPGHPRIEEALDRVRNHVRQDATLQRRYRSIAGNMEQLEAQSDAGAQFEALAGYSLEEVEGLRQKTEDAPYIEESAREAGAADSDVQASTANSHNRRDRPPVASAGSSSSATNGDSTPDRRRRYAKLGVAIAAALLVLYGALFAISAATQPEHERIADLQSDELEVEGYGYATRGALPAGEQNVQRLYLEALHDLNTASSSFLGLFPQYDQENLRMAEQRLEQVVNQTDEESFIHLEAWYWLAQARIAQNDIAGAQEALQSVIDGQGRMVLAASEQQAALQRMQSANNNQ